MGSFIRDSYVKWDYSYLILKPCSLLGISVQLMGHPHAKIKKQVAHKMHLPNHLITVWKAKTKSRILIEKCDAYLRLQWIARCTFLSLSTEYVHPLFLLEFKLLYFHFKGCSDVGGTWLKRLWTPLENWQQFWSDLGKSASAAGEVI